MTTGQNMVHYQTFFFVSSPSLSSVPPPSLISLQPSCPFPSPPPPVLRSRTPEIQLGGLGERCKLPQPGL